MPGMRARHWARPMRIASLMDRSSSVFTLGLMRSAIHKIIPKMSVVHATISTASNHDGSSVLSANPAMMTGIDPMIIFAVSALPV